MPMLPVRADAEVDVLAAVVVSVAAESNTSIVFVVLFGRTLREPGLYGLRGLLSLARGLKVDLNKLWLAEQSRPVLSRNLLWSLLSAQSIAILNQECRFVHLFDMANVAESQVLIFQHL